MDIQPRTTTYQIDDNSWLGSSHGTDETESVVLDLTTFNAAQYTNGFVPSGCALGKVTASGQYGPYDDTAADGRQTLVGFLYGGVRVASGATKVGAALFTHGRVKTARLPFQAGQAGRGYVDANGQADTGTRIRYV